MSPVAFEVAQLFVGFPEPVLILREREVRYRNPAAERLFPALRDRATLPEDLSALLPECEAPAVVTARIGGGNYRLSIQNTSLGALSSCAPPRRRPPPRPSGCPATCGSRPPAWPPPSSGWAPTRRGWTPPGRSAISPSPTRGSTAFCGWPTTWTFWSGTTPLFTAPPPWTWPGCAGNWGARSPA